MFCANLAMQYMTVGMKKLRLQWANKT